ncbi:MAG: hypothetical protein ABSG81_08900 [Acidimicrobiales bacterium]|jgi:vacuolar-type H+-ATPase subunit H
MSMSFAEPSDRPLPRASDLGPTTSLDDHAFEAVGETVRHAAGALDGLKDLLERLESSITKAADNRRIEEQIGQLFVRAQDFVDRAIGEAEELGRNMLAEAEFEASRIVAAARDEASRLVIEAQNEAERTNKIPPEAVRQLQATIDGFGRVNNELLRELSALNRSIATQVEQPTPYERRSVDVGVTPSTVVQPAAAAQQQPVVAPVHPLPVQPSTQPVPAEPAVSYAEPVAAQADPVAAQTEPPAPPESSGGYWDALRPAPRRPRHLAKENPGLLTRWQGR